MSKANCNVPNCKPSFKAVENFLRRVAHNLGNSPSRTEVKIVSCIPVDVTDLQQRIFQLQNELANIKSAKPGPTAEPPPTAPAYSACTRRAHNNPNPVCCNECLLSTTSVLSVYCPARCPSTDIVNSSSVVPSLNPLDRAQNATKTEKQNRSKNIFLKKRKTSKNKNLKTQLVYLARTDTHTPFRNNTSLEDNFDTIEGNKRGALNRAYLADVIQRQYQHRPLLNDCNLSDISSPICRDNYTLVHSQNSPYSDSDVCSCFHGQFQNIDNYLNNTNNFHVYSTCEPARDQIRSSYYDSNFYDIVPVKEKVTKKRNNSEIQKDKEPKKPNIKCWPGKARLKYRSKPTVVNYCSLSPARDQLNRKLPPLTHNEKHGVVNGITTKRLEASTPRQDRGEIEFSAVYTKQEKKQTRPTTIIPTRITKHVQNVGTSATPTDYNMAGRQTATTITDNDPPEDKTEATLNQIKNILQSVLTEVKTSTKFGNIPVQPKKDAVVQNGPSQASRGGYEYGASQLLQSYTYSPYNMNVNPYNVNPYKPSCSHPIPSNNYVYPEYPGVPGVPLQQYPLLIQPQKHLCGNYYRSNVAKPAARRAASAATNTEQAKEHSKETERLIKEIYKSIALNLEESSNENSVLEYIKTKSITDKYVNLAKTESDDTESERISKAISEIFKNTNIQDSTATGTTGSTFTSCVDTKKPCNVSEESVKKEHRTERVCPQERSRYAGEEETKRKSQHHYIEETSDTTAIKEVTEDSSSDTESDEEEVEYKKPVKTVGTVKATHPTKAVDAKKEKSGIFKKMLKMLQARPRRRRKDNVVNDTQKESESDSDDYQTVYSQTIDVPKPKVTAVRSRAHSKVFYSKQPQHWARARSPEKHVRTSPHTETEYRRYWDERQMFDNQRKRYATETSRGTGDRSRRTHAYYHDYEARPVFVDPVRRSAAGSAYAPPATLHATYGENYEQRNPTIAPRPPAHIKPHFVASKSNAKRKSIIPKEWLRKTKLGCGQCGKEWKDLILNG